MFTGSPGMTGLSPGVRSSVPPIGMPVGAIDEFRPIDGEESGLGEAPVFSGAVSSGEAETPPTCAEAEFAKATRAAATTGIAILLFMATLLCRLYQGYHLSGVDVGGQKRESYST